jgi:hypothetical protein
MNDLRAYADMAAGTVRHRGSVRDAALDHSRA